MRYCPYCRATVEYVIKLTIFGDRTYKYYKFSCGHIIDKDIINSYASR